MPSSLTLDERNRVRCVAGPDGLRPGHAFADAEPYAPARYAYEGSTQPDADNGAHGHAHESADAYADYGSYPDCHAPANAEQGRHGEGGAKRHAGQVPDR